MRYLSIFLLSPSLAYAACAPGVNYGSLDISTPSPVCIAYSGSTLGGCSAYCGGGGGGTVCVELPAATPPIKGPYFSDGNECTLSGGGDGGGDNGGGGNGGHNSSAVIGEYANPPRLVNYMAVGPNRETDLAPAFDSMLTELGMLKIGVGHLKKNTNHQINLLADIEYDTSRIYDTLNQIQNHDIQLGYDLDSNLTSIQSSLNAIVENTSGNGSSGGGDGGGSSGDTKALVSMMGSAMGMWASTQGNTYSTNDTLGYVNRELGAFRDQSTTIAREQLGLQKTISDDLSAIRDAIKNGSGSGGEGGEGDKPCSGPLCTFSPSGAVPGSGLSDVFGEVAIAGVKQQVTDKKAEIQAQMDEIKGVFSPGKLEVSGNYENDYHDINGARVDLSGKSNIELFFSSGPAQVIWFLAVLIAFGILLGGRRDA
ncbi:hypothetical protein [Aeromonas rivipollensis]|uniref:hypothetical protein n=1 Tax=Aeromonas rivipollensis TaxID=948519 RepID=UPI003989F265